MNVCVPKAVKSQKPMLGNYKKLIILTMRELKNLKLYHKD